MIKLNQGANSKDLSITDWIGALATLMPPSTVALIGAGDGLGEWCSLVRGLAPSKAIFVEAEEKKYDSLLTHLGREEPFEAIRALVGGAALPTLFYTANYEDESGTIVPEDLLELWPNLRTEGRCELDALSLDEMLDLSASDWLFIDCFPAVDILRNGVKQISRVRAVLAREMLTPGDDLDRQCGSAHVRSLLETYGLKHVITRESRHPGIGHSLYVRDIAQLSPDESDDSEAANGEDISADVVAEQSLAIHQSSISSLEDRLDALDEKNRLRDESVQTVHDRIVSDIEALDRKNASGIETLAGRIAALKGHLDTLVEEVRNAASLQFESLDAGLAKQAEVCKDLERRVSSLDEARVKLEDGQARVLQQLEKRLQNLETAWSSKSDEAAKSVRERILVMETEIEKKWHAELEKVAKKLAAVEDTHAKQQRRYVAAKQEINKAVTEVDLLKELFLQDANNR